MDRTGILIYGYKDDRPILLAIWEFLQNMKMAYKNHSYNSKAFMVIQIAKTVETEIVGPKKTIHWEDFLKTKFFRRLYTISVVQSKLGDYKREYICKS